MTFRKSEYRTMRAQLDAPAIEPKAIRLWVGLAAFFLPLMMLWLTRNVFLKSLSHAYCEGGVARDVFVGSLFAIGGFLLTYNDNEGVGLRLATKLGAMCAFGVALVPTACPEQKLVATETIHLAFAVGFFSLLVTFCVIFFRRARSKWVRKSNAFALRRSRIYAACGFGMVVMLLWAALGYFEVSGVYKPANSYFIAEAVSMFLFGFSWFTASHFLPWLCLPQEQLRFRIGRRGGGQE